MPYRNWSHTEILGAVSGFSALCGSLHYLLKVEEGKPFSWRELALHGMISAMCGLISYEILSYEGFPQELCGALSGLAGWGGTRLIRVLEIVINKKLGINKDDLK